MESFTSTPHRAETNGIAERAVRGVKEGTSAVLLQSGLDEKRWADSMEGYGYLRKCPRPGGWETPCQRRFGEPLKGPTIPFGAMVEYYPISALEQSRLHQFDKKVLSEIFLGYAMIAGEFGQEIFWLQTVSNWKRWTNQKFIIEESMRREC